MTINTFTANFNQGEIPATSEKSFSSMNDNVPERLFQLIINNWDDKPNASVNINHMIIEALSFNDVLIDGQKALLKYLIPQFAGNVHLDANENEIQWIPPSGQNATLPTNDHYYNDRLFSGYILAVNRLPYHQAMSVLINCPRFVIQHCGILISGQLYKIESFEHIAKIVYNVHLIEWNKSKGLQARNQLGLALAINSRNARSNGIPYIAHQRQIDWSFLTHAFNDVCTPVLNVQLPPKTVICDDDTNPQWKFCRLIANGNDFTLRSVDVEAFDGVNVRPPQKMRQGIQSPAGTAWANTGVTLDEVQVPQLQVMIGFITGWKLVENQKRQMYWTLNQ